MSERQRPTPILAAALGLTRALRWLTLRHYLRFFFPYLWDPSAAPETESVDASVIHRRAVAIDIYILLWIALEAAVLLMTAFRPTATTLVVAQGLVISRIIDLVLAGLGVSLFVQVRERGDDRVASAPRLVVVALIGYVELMACFSVIYASHRELLIQANRSASTVADAMTFAALTQMTISFGTQYPAGWLRPVAAVQVFFGLLLVVLIISRTMSSLRPLKSLDDDATRPPSPPAA